MAKFNSDLLRQLRLDLGMGQEEAARALQIDVRTYRRYESGAVNEGAGSGFDVRNASRRALLRRMCKELGVADEDAWLVPQSSSRPAAQGHALQRALHFVGREDVLERLTRFVRDAPSGVFQITGVGGCGKTAGIERFVATLRSKPWIHGFYDDPRTESVVEELARERGPLVVLDGVEAVQSTGGNGRAFGELEDPALRRALRVVCAARGAPRSRGAPKRATRRVIVTSRFPLTDLADWEGSGLQTLSLPPLSRDDGATLLRAWGLRGDRAVLAALSERTGGHALSVSMFGSYVGTFLEGDAARAVAIPDTAPEDDRIARRLTSVLESYAASLAEHERQLLARLSLFVGAATVGLLSVVASVPEAVVLRTVARLERLGLVARSAQGISAHPFVREHFRKLLGVPPVVAHAAIRDALQATLEGEAGSASAVRDPALLERYEALFTHTLRSKHPREAFGIYLHALGGFDNLGLRVGAMAQGARLLASFATEGVPGELDEDLPDEMRARILYEWALYAGALGDLALAERCHDAHLALLATGLAVQPRSRQAMGLRTRAYVAWLAADHVAARSLLEAAQEAARSMDDERGSRFHLARSFALAAMVEHDAGDAEAAMRSLAAARLLEATPTARRALWEAEIRLAMGDATTAQRLAAEALTDCARRGWVGHVAHARTVLGLSCVQEAPALARKHLQHALPWVRASHEVEMALRCHLLAARVGLFTNKPEAAERACDAGLLLARTHGFARFTPLFVQPPIGPIGGRDA